MRQSANEEFELRAHNFEPSIHYVVEQEVAIQGIKMPRGVELVLVTRQEIVVLPRVEPIVIEGVLVVVTVRYIEPIFNQ